MLGATLRDPSTYEGSTCVKGWPIPSPLPVLLAWNRELTPEGSLDTTPLHLQVMGDTATFGHATYPGPQLGVSEPNETQVS